jgi:cytochrome c oxidase subunit II
MLPVLSTMPPTVATYDYLLNWYLFFGIGAAIIVISLLVFFMVKYRDKGQKTPMPEHKVEGWKIVAVTVLISVSVLAAAEYQTFAAFGNIEIPSSATCMQDTGHPCVVVCAEGYQWAWNFTYPKTGQSCAQAYYTGFYSGTYGNLTVPMGWDVVVNISSHDVFHSLGITMLAEKEDAIPGKVNQLWFEVPALKVPTTPDVAAVDCNANSCFYQWAIRCFELCGVGHATMVANLTVVTQATWGNWTGGQIG